MMMRKDVRRLTIPPASGVSLSSQDQNSPDGLPSTSPDPQIVQAAGGFRPILEPSVPPDISSTAQDLKETAADVEDGNLVLHSLSGQGK